MKLLLVLLCCTISVATCTYDQCFRAAVYEHVKFSSVKENLDVFEQVAATASENGVQIVVFPENGVFTPLPVRDVALNNMEYIPNINGQDVKPVPCDEKEIYANRTILYRLSCSAKKHKMYIVADMGDYQPCDITTDPECPKDGFYLYNTQVAFGPKGNLIAKYHKRHLYGEFVYNTPEDELVYFDTPFGRFGMFICFDIIFKVPGVDLVSKYNVTAMLFSTHWFDEQPFLTSVHYHHSWAYANKVNLLSANLKAMRTASTGSGLYSSNSPLVTEHSVKGSFLLEVAHFNHPQQIWRR
ncbi:Pantetheinase [Halotydeus destructor]|nr:Pantetheinase [Halotydeus destructor]